MSSNDGVGMMIAGNLVEASHEDWLETLDPADGSPLARVPRGTAADVDRAVLAAALRSRPGAGFHPRSGHVSCARSRIGSSAIVMSSRASRAKTRASRCDRASADITSAVRSFEFYGGPADKIRGRTIPLGSDYVDYTVREPMRVSGQIIPWNYPCRSECAELSRRLRLGTRCLEACGGRPPRCVWRRN